MTQTPNQNKHAPQRDPHAFTLTEVIVAVAAVLILTVAIGQVFSSVSELVGTGSAIAETDQKARVITSQFADDANNFAGLPTEDTFLAIRSVEIGDLNRNGTLETALGETALYLSAEDRDFDQSNNIDPYTEGSRAVTRRLDQVMFLAGATRPYFTRQQASLEGTLPKEQQAIITWGHGLRAAIEQPTINDQGAPRPLDTEDQSTFPQRRFYPDGINPNNGDPWLEAYGAPFSSNELASRFPLTRTELILAGPGAFALDGPNPRSAARARREVAVLPRDSEATIALALGNDVLDNARDLEQTDVFRKGLDGAGFPRPSTALNSRAGLIAHGRVDILAMRPGDLKRYLQGQNGTPPASNQFDTIPIDSPPPDATPFNGGALDNSNIPNGQLQNPTYSVTPEDLISFGVTADAPLWIRTLPWLQGNVSVSSPAVSNDPEQIREVNGLGVRRALAGMIIRRLVQTEAPVIQRVYSHPDDLDAENFEDALMDNHAVIAEGCSNFEVAWSNGFRAPQDFSFQDFLDDGGTDPQYRQGEIVWFDAEHTFRELLEGDTTDPNNIRDAVVEPLVTEEFLPDDGDTTSLREEYDINFRSDFEDPDVFGLLPIYRNFTAAFSGGEDPGGADPRTEYIAAWGYQLPSSDGAFADPWPKPTHLRIRMTLHDQQNRIDNGKDYEFIVSLED